MLPKWEKTFCMVGILFLGLFIMYICNSFLGVFQKHFLIILIIQKSDIAPLIFINDIVKNINDISEFSRLHFLLYENTSCLKISYKKFVTPTLKCDIIVLLYIKAAK